MGKDKLEELWDKYIDNLARELAKLTAEALRRAIITEREEKEYRPYIITEPIPPPDFVKEYFEKGWRDYFWSEDDFEAKSDNWGE